MRDLFLLLLSSACLWTFTALKGIFRSPYYPRKYNNKASCTWHIIVPWNYTISLTFKDFSTEERCCTCDYVEVSETHKNGSTVLMQRFCDDKKPLLSKPFYSSGNNVTVFFHSDDTKSAKGFEAIYEAIPVNGKKRPSVASRCVNSAVMSVIKQLNAFGTAHRRTGWGGEGGCSPPKFWATRIFLGSERKFGQNQFFKTFPWFLNHYFEEINIFYFNLMLA